MASYNWFLIYHDDGRCGGIMRSGRRDSGVRGSPRVTPHSYLTKSAFSMMTRSSQLYLTRSGNRLIGFRCSGSMHDMPRAK